MLETVSENKSGLNQHTQLTQLLTSEEIAESTKERTGKSLTHCTFHPF